MRRTYAAGIGLLFQLGNFVACQKARANVLDFREPAHMGNPAVESGHFRKVDMQKLTLRQDPLRFINVGERIASLCITIKVSAGLRAESMHLINDRIQLLQLRRIERK